METEIRYQVFVSSTYTDLQEERRAVIQTLLEFGAIPAGMELFPAADEDAWALIQRMISECDYYLLLIGGRYGSVDEDGLSFTEKEFDYAVEVKKPVMAFLHGNPEKIEHGKSEKTEALAKRLVEFRQKVEESKHVKYWASAEDLAGKVALTLPRFQNRYPAVGWVRGDAVATGEALSELNRLRTENYELESRLRQAESRPPPGTEGFAQGDDEASFSISWDVGVRKKGALRPEDTWSFTDKLSISWNTILAFAGPSLMQEAEQRELKKLIERAFWVEHRRSIQKEAREWAEEEIDDIESKELSYHDLQLDRADFETILLQLIALNLIESSRRPRSVRDNGIYWSLTPYGHGQLVKLRALKKPDAEKGRD